MKVTLAVAGVIFLATTVFGTDPNKPEVGAKRAATLKANIKNFQLGLSYVGESDKPYYGLLLSVPKVNVKQADAFFLVAQLSEEKALKIIDHLADTGALDRAFEKGKDEADKLQQTSYRLTVIADDLQLSASLDWGQEMLKSLDELRKVLDEDAAKRMDVLLGRLSGHRKEWDASVKP